MGNRRRRLHTATEIGCDTSASQDCNNEPDIEEQFDSLGEARRIDAEAKKLLLSAFNRVVESSRVEEMLPDSIWAEWLWSSDALQECHMDIMLNRMHLLGLLVARYRATRQTRFNNSNASLTSMLGGSSSESFKRLSLFECPVRKYTLRQLLDTLLNLQVRRVH